LHDKLWLTVLAWLGILIVPALVGSLWIPDLAERIRTPRAHRARGWRPVRRVSLLAAMGSELIVRSATALPRRLRARNEAILREREARRG
jgi:hypothetical protein